MDAQLKGVTVEGNGGYGIWVAGEGAVAELEACTVRGNTDDDYYTREGGRIEGVDPSLITAG